MGRILDPIINEPVANASIVAIAKSFYSTYSNQNGYFVLEGLIPGDYKITINKKYYKTINWFVSIGSSTSI